MKDEIKEILELLNLNRVAISNGICRVKDFMSREQINKLLDYITNLQEENKTLKELNICVGCNNNPDYKSRNEKAIKYIRQHSCIVRTKDNDFELDLYLQGNNTEELLNILEGENNEKTN